MSSVYTTVFNLYERSIVIIINDNQLKYTMTKKLTRNISKNISERVPMFFLYVKSTILINILYEHAKNLKNPK